MSGIAKYILQKIADQNEKIKQQQKEIDELKAEVKKLDKFIINTFLDAEE